jgi:hypothetical protein
MMFAVIFLVLPLTILFAPVPGVGPDQLRRPMTTDQEAL